MDKQKEKLACIPHSLIPENFNALAELPYNLTVEHLRLAMQDFINFLGFINQQLSSREIERLESMLMPANFSSIVGEFMASSIPKYCSTLTKNQYHNGHPDLIPTGHFPKNAVQHADAGIEIKGSRYLRTWQGHNPEDTWLMVFVFDSSHPTDPAKEIEPRPFRFVKVVGARIVKSDWTFAGRSEMSRRTITASINESGFQKMQSNWIYQDFDYLKIARIVSPDNTLPEPLSESDIEVEN